MSVTAVKISQNDLGGHDCELLLKCLVHNVFQQLRYITINKKCGQEIKKDGPKKLVFGPETGADDGTRTHNLWDGETPEALPLRLTTALIALLGLAEPGALSRFRPHCDLSRRERRATSLFVELGEVICAANQLHRLKCAVSGNLSGFLPKAGDLPRTRCHHTVDDKVRVFAHGHLLATFGFGGAVVLDGRKLGDGRRLARGGLVCLASFPLSHGCSSLELQHMLYACRII